MFGELNSLRVKEFFFETNGPFTLSGDGEHQYHFANDLMWSGGPGYYLVRKENVVAGIQLIVSGEHKDVDRFRGKPAVDTGMTEWYIGPRLVGSYGRWSAELGG